MQSGFWVIPESTFANLCKPIHDIINYFISICPFESGKCGKEGKELQKFEYLENEKSFFNEVMFFYSSWRTIIWLKNKHLIKSSGHPVALVNCLWYSEIFAAFKSRMLIYLMTSLIHIVLFCLATFRTHLWN